MNILNSKIYREDIIYALHNNSFPELRDSSILITGGLGLIGSSVIDVLIELNELEGYNIEIYVAARKKMLFDDRYGCYNHIHFLQYDAMQPIQFKQYFDYIIHAAGLASPELYVSMPILLALVIFYNMQEKIILIE